MVSKQSWALAYSLLPNSAAQSVGTCAQAILTQRSGYSLKALSTPVTHCSLTTLSYDKLFKKPVKSENLNAD